MRRSQAEASDEVPEAVRALRELLHAAADPGAARATDRRPAVRDAAGVHSRDHTYMMSAVRGGRGSSKSRLSKGGCVNLIVYISRRKCMGQVGRGIKKSIIFADVL